MALGAVVLAAVLAGPATPTPPARDSWAALLGSGLLTVQDTATLEPGRFSFALTIDNRDRDPLGLDIFDGAVAVRAGVTRWAEAYGQFVLNRSVAVPDTPVNPPPPQDQLVPPGTVAPSRPWYSLYSPSPYVDDTGVIHFGAGHPGDAAAGAEGARPRAARRAARHRRVLRGALPARQEPARSAGRRGHGRDGRAAGRGLRMALGPLEPRRRDRLHTPWPPAYADRRIESRGDTILVTDEPLLLPYRVDLGIGARRVLSRSFAAVAEANTVFETGRRTTSLTGPARWTSCWRPVPPQGVPDDGRAARSSQRSPRRCRCGAPRSRASWT